MKPVVQLERTGCGIASVAALAGVGYKAAQRSARRLGIVATDERLWSETGYVRRLLAHYELSTHGAEMPFVSWSALPGKALLAIKWHRDRRRPYWHWVVFVRTHELRLCARFRFGAQTACQNRFWPHETEMVYRRQGDETASLTETQGGINGAVVRGSDPTVDGFDV